MLVQTTTIAKNTFIESVRQPVVFVVIMIAAVVQVVSTAGTGFSMGMTESSEVGADNKLLLDIGLSSVFGFGTLLAAFVATAVMSREIENKTVLTIVSKPVSRPNVVLGKYLGVAATIVIATVTMLVFLMLAIRHGVLSTSADEIDGPVLLFGFLALFAAMALGTWCNFFYGWSFPQTFVLLMFPFMLLAYILVLCLSKEWKFQTPLTDLKPQILVACAALVLSVLVLCAVATAASVRLGQVMTIVVCVGVFIASLMCDYFVGTRVFSNQMVGQIAKATPVDTLKPPGEFGPEQKFRLELKAPPGVAPAPGQPAYYGPTPNGFPLKTPRFTPFAGEFSDSGSLYRATSPALVVVDVDATRQNITLAFAGSTPMPGLDGPPIADDFLFLGPTDINPFAMAVWSAFPNLQRFWLLDAVSQNRPVPLGHLGLVAIYGILQITVFLSLAVLLFQRRDVG
jgi:ABC-2 type transport system permease protein